MRTIDYESSTVVTSEMQGIQEMVHKRLRDLPVSFADLGIDAQADFCNSTERYIKFELERNDAVFIGMPLIVQGNSGFIVEKKKDSVEEEDNPEEKDDPEEEDSAGLSFQRMAEGETLFGFIEKPKIWLVPPYSAILESSSVSIKDAKISVLLELSEAVLESHGVERYLSHNYLVYLALAYNGLRYARDNLTVL